MSEIQDLMLKINETRDQMINLLKEKENPLDPQVIEISQLLDSLLNDYYKVLRKSEK